LYGFGGWTCLAGFDEVEWTVPTGLEITTGRLSACKLAGKTFGQGLDGVISTAGKICGFLPAVKAAL
jgi:hypothetical protein